jgi:hypothetical protein
MRTTTSRRPCARMSSLRQDVPWLTFATRP